MRKKHLFFLFTTFLIFLMPLTSGYISLNIYVDESGNSLFLGESDELLSITLPENVKLENGEIIGRTQILTSKSGELWTFRYEFEGAELNVILPENAVIRTLSPETQISLENNHLSLFALNSILVEYELEELGSSFSPNNLLATR